MGFNGIKNVNKRVENAKILAMIDSNINANLNKQSNKK